MVTASGAPSTRISSGSSTGTSSGTPSCTTAACMPCTCTGGRGSEEMKRLLARLDRLLARRAVPPHRQRGSACVVARRLCLPGVPRAPAGQQPQRSGELAAGGGQLVDEPRRALGVGARHHHAPPPEPAQPRGQDVGGDAGRVVLEVV